MSSPLPDPYDALMDHLAALAVAAVQQPGSALHAYWLLLASAQPEGPAPLAAQVRHTPVPDWARPSMLQALQQVCAQGLWCEPGDGRQLQCSASIDAITASLSRRSWPWPAAWRPYLDDIAETTGRIWQAACQLYQPVHQTHPGLPMEVRRGAVLFDAGLYFACHEYFETLWGRTADAASDWYQGLIQVAVAMRHLESHNVRGAILLLRAGLGRLQRYPPLYKALPLAAWRQRLTHLLADLENLSAPTAYQFEQRQVPSLLTP
ncbi:MAG: DUF309 domain-containing protein [Candidatus Tectimicrobiota bacterium]